MSAPSISDDAWPAALKRGDTPTSSEIAIMSLKSASLFAPLLCAACSLPPEAEQLQGTWISDGYGIAAQVKGGRVDTYAISDKTCISEGSDPLFGLFAVFDVDIAADNRAFLLRQKDTAQAIRFNRVATLPERCATPPADTPTANLETFLDIFATHYAFFDLYGVDWNAQSARARAQVTDTTSDAMLFGVMAEAIAPLQDGHIGLKARINGEKQIFEPNPGALFARIQAQAIAAGENPDTAEKAFRDQFWDQHIAQTILRGQGTTAGEGFVQYGILAPKVGYISFLTMAAFGGGDIGNLQGDLIAINGILDDVFASFDAAGVERVVIDMSLNFGGYDEVALAIANRFAAAPVFAYSEYPFDAVDPIDLRRNVTPSNRANFIGPLTLLTSDMTVSAGEILTLALRALPQTTHVGEATRGAFSDVLEKELQNGWIVELSNEVYTDNKGNVWEGRGVTPHHQFAVLEGPDPLQSHQSALERILGLPR